MFLKLSSTDKLIPSLLQLVIASDQFRVPEDLHQGYLPCKLLCRIQLCIYRRTQHDSSEYKLFMNSVSISPTSKVGLDVGPDALLRNGLNSLFLLTTLMK